MVFTAVLGGYEKYVAINIVNSLSYIGRAVFIVLTLRAGWGLTALAFGTLGMSLAVLAAKWAVCGFRIRELRLSLRFAHWGTMKMLIGYGIPSIVITVSSLVRTKFDNVIIGRFVDVGAVAVYGVASMIIQYFFNAINTGIGVITPRFARLGGRARKGEQQSLFTRSLFVGSVLACGGGMMIVLFGGRFISFWVGDGFEAAVPVLWILTAAYVPELAQSSGFGLLLAENKHRGLAKLSLVEAVANLSISIALVIRFGIVGAALGTAIPMMVTKLIVQPVLVSRAVGLPLGSYYKPLIRPLIVGAVITGVGVFGGMTPFLEGTKFVGFVAVGAAVGVLYLVLVYMMTRNLPYMPSLSKVFRGSTSA
jgi:O-antigen/teichoic acid export membrane protein